jgi:hypothetical protein
MSLDELMRITNCRAAHTPREGTSGWGPETEGGANQSARTRAGRMI